MALRLESKDQYESWRKFQPFHNKSLIVTLGYYIFEVQGSEMSYEWLILDRVETDTEALVLTYHYFDFPTGDSKQRHSGH